MFYRDFIHSKFIIGLAPMDGVTDEPFRLVQAKIAKPDVIVTEFVSAEGITRGGAKLYDVLLYSPLERPIVGQIFGKDPESFYKAAVVLTHLGFDGLDINMGCPAKTVTQNGAGAALIGTPDLAASLISNLKRGINDYISGKTTINDLGLNQKTISAIERNLKYSQHVPTTSYHPTVSVKTRLGIADISTDVWIPFLLKQNLDYITLHGRTLKQGYSGLANWEEITKAAKHCQEAKTIFWGNGDIISLDQAKEYQEKFRINGILIGRSAMGNPWIFKDYLPTLREKYDTMLLHAQVFKQVFPTRTLDCLRHHFLLYASGHPNAKALRAQIVKISTLEDILALEAPFLS